MNFFSKNKMYLNSCLLLSISYFSANAHAQSNNQELKICRENSENCYKPLTIVNDRSEPVWVSVLQNQLVLWHKKRIEPHASIPFLQVPKNGMSSLTFKIATGCSNDPVPKNCVTGEVRGGLYALNENDVRIDFKDAPPSEKVNSVDFVTKAEFTFGCFKNNPNECAKTPQGNYLPAYTNFNLSAVDGFSVPLKIEVLRDTGELQNTVDCPIELDASHLSVKNCADFNGYSLSAYAPADINKSNPIGCYSPNKFITTAKIFGGLEQKESDGENYQYACNKLFGVPPGETEDLAVIECRNVYQGPKSSNRLLTAGKHWGKGKAWTDSIQHDKFGNLHAIYSFPYDDIAALKQCNSMRTEYKLHILDEILPPVVTPPVVTPPTSPEVLEHTQNKIKICTQKYGGTGFVDLHYSFVEGNNYSSPQMNVRMNDHPTDKKQACYEILKPLQWKEATLKYHFTKINEQGVGDTAVVYSESKPTAGTSDPIVTPPTATPIGYIPMKTDKLEARAYSSTLGLNVCMQDKGLSGGLILFHYQLDKNAAGQQNVILNPSKGSDVPQGYRCFMIQKSALTGHATLQYFFTVELPSLPAYQDPANLTPSWPSIDISVQ